MEMQFDEDTDEKSQSPLEKTQYHGNFVPDMEDRRTYPAETCLNTDNEVYVMDEIDLLGEFANQVCYFDPDVVLSWNLKTSLLYLIERSFILAVPWFTSMIGKFCDPFDGKNNDFRHLRSKIQNGHYNDLINGRTIYNFWKVARDDLQLRSTSFAATCQHVINQSCPKFEREVFANAWETGKQYVVKRWMKIRGKRLALIVDKLGSLSLGAEISTLCNISGHAAITRGSQIRQEGLFCEMARQFNFTLPSPTIEDRKTQRAVVSLPLNMEPYSEYYTSGVTVLDFKDRRLELKIISYKLYDISYII